MSTENFTDPSMDGEQQSGRKMFDISQEQRTETRFDVSIYSNEASLSCLTFSSFSSSGAIHAIQYF